MLRQRKIITNLLTILLLVQSPLSLAFSCSDPVLMELRIEAQMETKTPGEDIVESKCHGESNAQGQMIDDEASCDSSCCLALSAQALNDSLTVDPGIPVHTLLHALSDQLIDTYIKSENRPPIS